MKETDKAVIQFLGYRVSEISYTCPVTLEFPSDAKISCNMNFSKALGRISETRVQEKLRVNLWHTIGGCKGFSIKYDWRSKYGL